MPKKHFVEAKVSKDFGEMNLILPNITYDELPCVSVLTITYCRKHFFQLMWNNWNNYKYPKDKLEWIIIDDSPGTDHDLYDILPNYPNIHYIRVKNHMSVGEKRNFGVSKCNYDIIVHQDDDDYYFPDSILAKVRTLKLYPKCGCCFSNNLAAYNIIDNISYVIDPQVPESCLSLPEATMMYKRSFHSAQPFPTEHFGEGKGFARGRQKKFVSIPCIFNMIAFTHSRNMTGLARYVETKSIKTSEKLANYYDLFDGITKNIIRKINRISSDSLLPTQYTSVHCYNQYGFEQTSQKILGQKEISTLCNLLPNYHEITNNSIDSLLSSQLSDNDLILVCMYNTDILSISNSISKITPATTPSTTSLQTFDSNSIKLLQHPRAKLLIYNSWECRNFLDPLAKSQFCTYCLKHLNISLDKIVIATTDFLNPIVHSLAPQIIGYDFPYLYAKANLLHPTQLGQPPPTTSTYGRNKAIVMLSRRGSIERTAAALFLYTYHKDSTIISYLTSDKYDTKDITQYGVVTSKYTEFQKSLPLTHTSDYTFDKEAEEIYGNKMVHVNWESLDDIQHMVSQTFVMLTLETNDQGYSSHCQQVSEKTYKAIQIGMPFILFTSRPGILKHLKSLGFKTFHPYIDESYDYPTIQEKTEDREILQKQYYDRFRKMIKEVHRICKMSQDELIQLWNQCQPIVQHNYNLLKSTDYKTIKSIPIIEK
jgi:hypothetical protein